MRLPLLSCSLVFAALAACSSPPSSNRLLGFISPYRVEIVQGNVLTAEQLARVKPGMTRTQVRDALGTPLLTDVFHADRWDYVFTLDRQGVPPQRRSVTAWFKDDRLERIDAADLPNEHEFVASINTHRPGRIPALALTDEQRKALPPPTKAEVSVATPQGPVRDYPPLETLTEVSAVAVPQGPARDYPPPQARP